jgi:hypothetical protein
MCRTGDASLLHAMKCFVVSFAFLALSTSAAAQRVLMPTCPVTRGQVYFEFQVSTPAVFLSGARGATHLVPLRDSAVLRIQFIVDTLGRVEQSSLKSLRIGDTALFGQVNKQVGHWRFRPAIWKECARVRQLVQVGVVH